MSLETLKVISIIALVFSTFSIITLIVVYLKQRRQKKIFLKALGTAIEDMEDVRKVYFRWKKEILTKGTSTFTEGTTHAKKTDLH